MDLKPCPCGSTPTSLHVFDGDTYRYSRAYGDCCSEWGIEFRSDNHPRDDERVKRLAVEAWNDAPRAGDDNQPSGIAG